MVAHLLLLLTTLEITITNSQTALAEGPCVCVCVYTVHDELQEMNDDDGIAEKPSTSASIVTLS